MVTLADYFHRLSSCQFLVVVLLRHFAWLPWRDHISELQSCQVRDICIFWPRNGSPVVMNVVVVVVLVLRSSTMSALVAPRTVHATVGDRAFPAAAASVWNSLPESVRSSPSLTVFRRRLKTELFLGLTAVPTSLPTMHRLTWLFLLLRVLAVLGLHATLKAIRSSSSSSSSSQQDAFFAFFPIMTTAVDVDMEPIIMTWFCHNCCTVMMLQCSSYVDQVSGHFIFHQISGVWGALVLRHCSR